MPNDSRYAALERQHQDLREQFEEFRRQVLQNTENRNTEIGTLRESLSAVVSAADRDAATIESYSARLGAAEERLSAPPPPTNWIAIIGLVLASSASLASVGDWALGHVRTSVERLEKHHEGVARTLLSLESQVPLLTDSKNRQERAEDRLRSVEITVNGLGERLNAVEAGVRDIHLREKRK